MYLNFAGMIRLFSNEEESRMLTGGKFGLELESQRITSDGDLALTPHPSIFGDKAENPCITTDFSESQIEMITPAFQTVEEVYESLESIRLEVENGIGDELLWPLSMPPRLPAEDRIPIARFADSKEGREKEAYRNGLAQRYGKKMQMISGIHYNFSFSDELIDYLFARFGEGKNRRTFADEMYFALTRNFLRYRWLLIYLYGASPICDSTYYSVISRELAIIQKCCPCCRDNIGDYMKYAASLRVSRFGYANAVQGKFNVFYNSLNEYTRKIRKMMNGNVLQKESEFYSSIRLKQNTGMNESQLSALNDRGVKYIEVRILDLNPFEQLGISLHQLYFMQVFMLYCLLEQSRGITSGELRKINSNHHLTALFGRKQDLLLHDYSRGRISLKDFGERIFEKLKLIAGRMDQGTGDNKYLRCVEIEHQKLSDTSLLPSERIFREVKENDDSFRKFGIRYAVKNSDLKKGEIDYEYKRLRRA
jgi:glutamate--cysteine ligase